MEPIAAVVAAAEPDSAPKNAEATTITWARPPAIQPTRQSAKRTIRLDIPPTSISFPASMKKGIAIRVKESTEAYVLWANVATFIPLPSIISAVGSPMETTRGTFRNSKSSRSENKIKVTVKEDIYAFPPSSCVSVLWYAFKPSFTAKIQQDKPQYTREMSVIA